MRIVPVEVASPLGDRTGLQVPILDAVIAKKPKAIMIAPNDKVQLIEPLRKAHDAGIAVVCVDTFIGTGVFQGGFDALKRAFGG